MEMWIFVLLIIAAAFTGALAATFIVFLWALSILHNQEHRRRSR